MNLKELLAKLAKGESITMEEKTFIMSKESELSDEEKETVENAEVSDADEEEVDEDAMEKFLKSEIGKKVDAAASKIAEKAAKKITEARAKAAESVDDPKDKAKVNKEIQTFIKALLQGDVATMKAVTTSKVDTAKGGFTIPETLETEILRVIEEDYGVARREMGYQRMENGEMKITTGGALSVYWTDEGAKKTSTEPTFGVVTLTLKKLAAIVPLTDEVIEDSNVDLLRYIADLFGEAIAKQEDLAFFNGDGTVFTGVANSDDVNEVKNDDGITDANLHAVIDATPSAALAGAKWFGHRSVKSAIKALTDGSGNYLYPEFRKGGDLLEFPFVSVEAMPTLSSVNLDGETFLLFGNLKKAAIYGETPGIAMKVSSEATIRNVADSADIHLFEQDMTAIRAVKRTGYVLAMPTLMTALRLDVA